MCRALRECDTRVYFCQVPIQNWVCSLSLTHAHTHTHTHSYRNTSLSRASSTSQEQESSRFAHRQETSPLAQHCVSNYCYTSAVYYVFLCDMIQEQYNNEIKILAKPTEVYNTYESVWRALQITSCIYIVVCCTVQQ